MAGAQGPVLVEMAAGAPAKAAVATCSLYHICHSQSLGPESPWMNSFADRPLHPISVTANTDLETQLTKTIHIAVTVTFPTPWSTTFHLRMLQSTSGVFAPCSNFGIDVRCPAQVSLWLLLLFIEDLLKVRLHR